MISSISNFPSIFSLKTLSISNNNLNDLSSFVTSAKTKYPTLTSLNTFRNPMNPGVNQAQQYSQYKSYIRQIGKLTELDGMNINDNSFMSQQQQPKRDLFGTSTGAQPKRDLFGTSSSTITNQPTNKVNFFDNTPATNTNMNSNMMTNMNSNMMTNMNANMNTNMNANQAYASQTVSQVQNKPKMGMFDAASNPTQAVPKTTNMSNMFATTNPVPHPASSANNSSGLIFKRQFYTIDESEEYDGTEFVRSKKKKSIIMVNEKILKKSDNMTKFNRKNKSEGNKHILNSEL
jgi:hypothetical protein